MGFFDFFRPSPASLVKKGQRAINAHNFPTAIQVLERALSLKTSDADSVREEAKQLLNEAQGALAKLNLEEASLCLNAGDADRAEEHISLAEQYQPEARELRRLRKRLERVRRGRSGGGAGSAPEAIGVAAGMQAEGPLDSDAPEQRWEVLLFTYKEDVAEIYKDRDGAFREGLLLLQDGNAKGAMSKLNTWLKTNAGDSWGHLERGRARMLAGDLRAAAADFQTFQEAEGWRAVDEVGTLHVGRLLGESLMRLGAHKEAAEALGAAIETTPDDASLPIYRGQCLLALKELDEAEQVLTGAVSRFPKVVDAYLVLAQVFKARKDNKQAIDILEAGVRPNCEGPGCGAKAFHAEAYRFLTGLYLEEGSNPDRVDQLLKRIFNMLKEEATWIDHLLMARFCTQIGNLEAATDAKGRALAKAGGNARLREAIEAELQA